MSQISVLGATSWGTTLAILLGRNGHEVTLVTRTASECRLLSEERVNRRFLPGYKFPANLKVESNLATALPLAKMVIVAVPSVSMRWNIARIRDYISTDTAIVSASKGMEVERGWRMTHVISSELSNLDSARIGAISGPNVAAEVAAGLPTSATLAFLEHDICRRVQRLINSDLFRVYASHDVTGVEMGGALKNIISIGAGVIDGLNYGENAKSAFITRGLHEMVRFCVALGALPETLYGLSGLGDLIATCNSKFTRNRRFGEALATGASVAEALQKVEQVVEGVPTCQSVARIARKVGINMPITFAISDTIEGKIAATESLKLLMTRPLRDEASL